MRGIFRTAFGTFALLSAVRAIPNGRNTIDIDQVSDSILAPKQETPNQEIPLATGDIHTAEEFAVTLMFDEVVTEGNYIWPDGYGNLEWSTNHYIFNQSEQNLFHRNRASSPPNLLYVQDSSHTGGAEPNFKVRANSPAEAFDLHGISILPYTASPKAPILFSIRGYPANGGTPHTRWYKWTSDAQLQYPWEAKVEGIDFVNKVEIYVVPGSETTSKERLPYTLDNIKITWRNPFIAAATVEEEEKDLLIIENHQGLHPDL